MPQADQIRAAVAAYVDSFNRRDRDRFLGALADGVVQIDPVGSPPNVGKVALAAFWDSLYAHTEAIEFRVVDLFVTGDEAALLFHITQLSGDGATEIDGIDVFRVDDAGLISMVRGYSDIDHIKKRGDGP
jgi:steroid delta-isomerase